MTQPIDPTMWPKVENYTVKESGYYWCINNTNRKIFLTCVTASGESHSQNVTLYGPITFATDKNMPQVIDPKGASMIPDQHVQIATKLEHGKTYLRAGGISVPCVFTVNFSAQKGLADGYTYYGPIDTTPSIIDLSHFDLSKIEPKSKPDKPGVWHCSKEVHGEHDFMRTITSIKLPEGSTWSAGKWRYLCDFIPPTQSPVIPPKPENVLHLMRLTRKIADDDVVGEVHWCVRSKSGNAYIIESDGKESGRYWLACQCEPVTE